VLPFDNNISIKIYCVNGEKIFFSKNKPVSAHFRISYPRGKQEPGPNRVCPAKPFPASPGWAASMAAFMDRKFACAVILWRNLIPVHPGLVPG
jgi:hypothetical protein